MAFIPTVCNKFRTALAVIILATAVPAATAETHYKPRISIGGRAGMSMSRISLSPSVRQGWLTGTAGSLTFRYTEEKLFGLVAELGWNQRGWSENFSDPNGEPNPLSYKRTLTYINLPVMTHIYFGTRRMKFFFNAGPEASYMISSSIASNFDYHNPTSSPHWPTRSRMTEQLAMEISNRFDYGITAGAGGEFYLNPRNSINMEVRFYYGLGNIFPAKVSDTFSASRCMSLEVTLGYWFRIK
ncbi:MAG: PorT family protein [Muribaculaceae bacterium]|nr:PorT family protein [Muribaculaceae bacterium]MDE6130957.1 PorT family protein [Muribaculaceae bacterium]